MGIPDSSLLDLVEKVKCWIFLRESDTSSLSGGLPMAGEGCNFCYECEVDFTESSVKYHCQSCARWLCVKCVQDYVPSKDVVSGGSDSKGSTVNFISCKFCSNLSTETQTKRKYSDKVYPAESPRESPEPPSPNCSGERITGHSPHAVSRSSVPSFSAHLSPASVRCSFSRSNEDDAEDSISNFFSSSIEYFHDPSDIETCSFSTKHEFYTSKSVGSSPSDSPSRIHITSNVVGRPVQREQQGNPMYQNDGSYDQESLPVLRGPENGNEDPETVDASDDNSLTFQEHYRKLQKPLDFENNGLIWSPPPPEREGEETENDYFTYDDDDDEIGDTNAAFFSSGNVDTKESLQAVVHGHFRALVSQLLQSEGIKVGKENGSEDWLDIITAISWQAATFVKPDTSRGGSMDPVDYIKVKCIASGSPGDSTLVKGVVCTKNIKHKRMTSQYKNPTLLLLGGALEFQGESNQLESFDILRQKEMDHLKMVVSKIEALRTNVLLVEKSASSYAQEYLLAKDISLVLNVKRSLLERIARCSGALVTPSVEKISAARLGHCELFHLERVLEEHEPANQLNKKPSKTLMFFGGCPRRLGCTVLLKGSCRRELMKLKHVVHYAVFAAYHLSLETSFLADEGASLPKIRANPLILAKERASTDSLTFSSTDREFSSDYQEVACIEDSRLKSDAPEMGNALQPSSSMNPASDNGSSSAAEQCDSGDVPRAHGKILNSAAVLNSLITVVPDDVQRHSTEGSPKSEQEENQPGESSEIAQRQTIGESEESIEYYSSADSHQSLLVSFSSHCLLNQTICERSWLHRIKFYGPSDKPLGRYLHDHLFNQRSSCKSCKESTEDHVICYMHKQGNLTINVKQLPSSKLPGEQDGKIWMWHRCLRCPPVDGVPPASPRVVMSDAAWGLSFGKFLELSFSNHATANRVATCGHSLQKDCLRYYGYGSMVAFFRYSPVDILSVCLPPSVLNFKASRQNWIRKEANELFRKMEVLYAEMSRFLCNIDEKLVSFGSGFSDVSELHNHVMELKDLLTHENSYYKDVLNISDGDTLEPAMDILELNRIRLSLLIASHVWDHRLYSLNYLLTRTASSRAPQRSETLAEGSSFEHLKEENVREFQECLRESKPEEPNMLPERTKSEDFIADSFEPRREENVPEYGLLKTTTPSAASVLSDTIDSAWTGSGQIAEFAELARLQQDGEAEDIPSKKVMSPSRVYSFDSHVRLQERITKGIPPASLHMTMHKSFHASGDYRNMIRDPITSVQRTYSQMLSSEAQKFDALKNVSTSFVSTASLLSDGARLMVRHNGQDDIVIAVYDNEPTSIISYVLSSKEHKEWVCEKANGAGLNSSANAYRTDISGSSNISSWPSFGSLDLDYMHYGNFGSEDSSSAMGSIFSSEQTIPPHFRYSFENESSSVWGKAKFSVTCYFAKQFDALRKKSCPSEVDFIRSISRCKPWRAQGGKSNVYFAKSLDDRFIIKQVTKTELESFGYFAPSYFDYMTDSLDSGSPTCLAKVLGIYQVVTKHLKGGKETKMDLMVMENLFFNRKISRVYDLKGSVRSRYNSDTTGEDKVLLDMNLLETLRTQPIFLGSKAKRSLERAVWNDTSFLASVDVMDYSLLVGIDDESKELVLGIIDYMRQYTWDKHLETWVKASGILGGPKNASPTIVSPKQYKKRFRKAMTTYFLTLPDQWSHS